MLMSMRKCLKKDSTVPNQIILKNKYYTNTIEEVL